MRQFQMNELDDLCLLAYKSSKLYKEWTNIYHDQHVKQNKQFKEKDQVLLINSLPKLFPGK